MHENDHTFHGRFIKLNDYSKGMVINMTDQTLIKTMLFDFYGETLTDKQQEYYDLYHNDDLSLSEIADSAGISKQGVHDIIVRAEKKLMELEQKTGIINKWSETRAKLEQDISNGAMVSEAVQDYFLL